MSRQDGQGLNAPCRSIAIGDVDTSDISCDTTQTTDNFDNIMSECISTNIWAGTAWLQPNFCASLYTSGLIKPRGLHIGSNNEILLVERGRSRVVRLDNDGTT